MARGQRYSSSFKPPKRQGQTAVALGVAAGAFGLVLAAVFLAREASPPTPSQPAPQVVETPGLSQPTNTPAAVSLDQTPSQPEPVAATQSATNGNEPIALAVPEVAPQPEPVADRIKDHITAGEFGVAMDLAQTVLDINERATMFRLIADAQIEAGEFDGAMQAIQRISVPQLRGEARGHRAQQEALAGGGSLANFQPLIDLIQQETSGPWTDIDGTGGTISSYDTGVRVDPNGLLGMLSQEDLEGRLEDLGIKARAADLNEDMAQASPMRVVSLTRLEAEIAKRLEAGLPIITTMNHLAGLSRVQYVFVEPTSREIMIAGPAEGWEYNEAGIPVGVTNSRPTLQLDDFVTVMRIFSPSGSQFFNCLIVPRKEGLKNLSAFVERSNARGSLSAGPSVRNFARKCEQELGLQDAVFNGVPLDSRVARVILEADYRMKLIGIDKLEAGPNVPSYFDLLTPEAIQKNPPKLDALRWWMTMKYDAVLHSPSRTVFEIQGPSVQCLSENELIEKDGERIHTGQADPVNQLFAQNFTQHYAELAQQDLVFADLRNVFDLSLVAALMHQERLTENTARGYGVFGVNGGYQPARFEPAKAVMSVVNHRVYNGRDVIVQVAGGVRADLVAVLRNDEIYREAGRLEGFGQQAQRPELPEGRWWWDVR